MPAMKVDMRALFALCLAAGVLVLAAELLVLVPTERFLAAFPLHYEVTWTNATFIPAVSHAPRIKNNVPEPMKRANEQPNMVLILSYQRCGSTFFGRLLDEVAGSVYVFEPIDALYSAMYGTPNGWNVPTDIMNWPNGSQRIIPDDESNAVSVLINNILECDFTSIPTEFFLHRFLEVFRSEQSHLQPFMKCLGNTTSLNPSSAHSDCYKHIKGICPNRFGANIIKQTTCKHKLWNSITTRPMRHHQRTNRTSAYNKYMGCMDNHRSRIKGCIDDLTLVCQASHVRSTKTVRVTMDSVEIMLKTLPNLKVVHLIRDPRAVVLSRKNFGKTAKGINAKGNINEESTMFCRNLVRDIAIRHRLEVKYPGSFMEVLYDRFVSDPLENARDIFRFIGATWTDSVKNWVVRNTQITKKSAAIADKWMSSLSVTNVMLISRNCKEVFELVDYDWVALEL